jgi:polyphosphate glucokinase
MFDALLHIDRLYVGGGNAKKLTVDLGHRAEVVDNSAGILGGIKLWELDEPLGSADRDGEGPNGPIAHA